MIPIRDLKAIKIKVLVQLFIVALLIGIVVGVIDTVFGRVLLVLTSTRDHNPLVFLPFLPIIGLLIVYSYQHYGGLASKGMGLLFQVSQNKEKTIPKRLIPLVMLSTWATHLFGGSAGREGVAVQLGATIGSWFHQKWPNQVSSKVLLVTGMAAGFAGLFQTPIAAVFFACEVFILGQIEIQALFPAIIASFTSSFVSHQLGLEKFSVFVSKSVNLSPIIFVKLIILGFIFGLVGNLFAFSLARLKKFWSTQLVNPYKRIFIGALFLTALLIILYQGRYAGLGTNLISQSFSHSHINPYDWCLKLFLTVLTISIGYQGGEVTPLFAIGATLGVTLAPIFGLPVEVVASLGYIAVFSSATNTFLAPIFIGVEVFGNSNILAYFLVVSFAYLTNRNYSIYADQESLL
ncbi:hypothetical protein HMPREF9318_00042 [Streptococcus urinalis FB127-CNA-2]|uniref:Chloride transporter, ClC family n=2 Tax=Streptococcus urinalis TaxID=149016 RepID=G5KEE8_9STRE|nr:chloride transporter, ClC family [Streptococcus urinalis 2285-97]EKS21844.1 hypothetical protein HMPREF9318_00042 [Streptococcus urinalis FB127-CNA-2]VEF31657.1 permease chloride channel [Streptococcus urinalis]